MIFDYPKQRESRRHGPDGYSDYESFRDWLRDEFCFRCIYCLKRETWGRVTGDFELDHFEPQSIYPEKALSYENLVYACRTCNSIKSAAAFADPLQTLHSSNLRCDFDGCLVPSSKDACRLIEILDLNSPQAIEWRQMWLRIVSMANKHDQTLLAMLIGFPKILPDLSPKKPPTNLRPEGISESWFAKRERNELPDSY